MEDQIQRVAKALKPKLTFDKLMSIIILCDMKLIIEPSKFNKGGTYIRVTFILDDVKFDNSVEVNNYMGVREGLEFCISRVMTPPYRKLFEVPEHKLQGEIQFVENSNLQSSE